MKKLYLILSLLLLICVGQSHQVSASTIEELTQYERLYFQDMEVKADVSETGLVKIETTINANFLKSGHGIYAYIPQKYEMDFGNGHKKYYWPVKNFKLHTNQKYEVDSNGEDNYFVVKIGDADTYVRDLNTYTYSYEIQMNNVDVKDYDLFYFNILGSGWKTIIENYQFQINFPKSFAADQVSVFSGAYGDESNSKIAYTIEQNSIKGNNLSPLLPHNSVTVRVNLEDGYFSFPTYFDYSLPILGVLGGLVLLTVFWFNKYGNDEPIVETIEAYPPQGFSSAMVGYVYDDRIDNLDIISLFLEWASLGYLKIEGLEKKSANYTFVKLKDIPTDRHPSYEVKLFNDLFRNREKVSNTALEEKFYTKIEAAKTGLDQYFRSEKRSIYTKQSLSKQLLVSFFSTLAITLYLLAVIFNKVRLISILFIPAIVFLIASVFFAAIFQFILFDFSRNRLGGKVAKGFVLVVLTAGYTALYSFFLKQYNTITPFDMVAMALFFIIILINAYMPKRTEYGNMQFGKILGFRDFLVNAEKERLETLLEENPHYYFDILPYAYALGVSNIWANKFEGIAMEAPESYGTGVIFSPVHYNNSMMRALEVSQRSMISVPVKAQSGGFSGGGGGFSGGGFSGGGFGGGGGGGW